MATLDDFIPEPRLCEVDRVQVGAPPEAAYLTARDFDFARAPLIHALFWLRTLPERMGSVQDEAPPLPVRLADIGRSGVGFQVLAEERSRLIVGAIGRFWEPEISWKQVPADEFARFSEPGWGKVAWELRTEDAEVGSCIAIEVRVTATDDRAWRAQQRYFRLIGPFSRFIRHHALAQLARALGTPEDAEALRPLPGDGFVRRPRAELTHAITIEAAPEAVWPWLVQLGCRRAGWYSHDDLDNAGVLSATEIVPELQHIAVGDVLPMRPEGDDGFTVLAVDAPHALVLGGLVDTTLDRRLAMEADKPERYWQSTWAFVLEPLGQDRTRLIVRVRVDYEPAGARARLGVRAMGLVHHFMQKEQLENLKLRAEGHVAHVQNTWTDVGEGMLGAAQMLSVLVTPFRRASRAHWGTTREEAERAHPGDEYVPEPVWQWTHAIDIDAPPAAVWPWVVQLGQDKGGFYSYQFLENLVGSRIQNASRVHPEWQELRSGDALRLHPYTPPLTIAVVEPGRMLIARGGVDPRSGAKPREQSAVPVASGSRSFVAVSWAFLLQPLGEGKTRLISRFRSSCSSDLATRVMNGPYLTGSIGFVMDRRMLRGIKARVEDAAGGLQSAPPAEGP